jgi:periplasmic protein TonB
MSSFRWVLIGGSLLAHGGLVVALGGIRTPAAIAATAIDVTETTKKEAPPPVAEVEPPPPQNDAPPRAPPMKAAAAPPPEAAPSPVSPSLANLPDLGLELSGGGGGGPGLAVPAVDRAPLPRALPITKTLEKTPPKAADACTEGPAKPKLLNLPQPSYTEAARSAGVEGKVRVEVTVDENGKVVDVRILSALGHGLDEAALAAARAASFQPAMRCGRASRATFTIAMRFSAS